MFCKRFDWRKEFKNVWNAGYAGGRRFPKTEIDWLRLQKIIGHLISRHQLRKSYPENVFKAWHPLNWCLQPGKQVKLVQISSAGSNRSDLAQVLIKEFRLNYIGCAPLPWQDVESDSWLQSDLEEELVNLHEEQEQEQELEHTQDILNLLPLVQCANWILPPVLKIRKIGINTLFYNPPL